MKAFLERAKRKRTPGPDEDIEDGDEPTEVKLAMLASLYPGLEQEVLLDVLLAHDGSVSAATSSLRCQNQHGRKKSAGVVGYQQSMTQFAVSNSGSSPTKKKIKAKRGVPSICTIPRMWRNILPAQSCITSYLKTWPTIFWKSSLTRPRHLKSRLSSFLTTLYQVRTRLAFLSRVTTRYRVKKLNIITTEPA
uniref:CUE domain-containing protein n=1 Tax=Bionectria ochroleuca TaxID=29856 RepID=A0A8H7NPD0_BIOOC